MITTGSAASRPRCPEFLVDRFAIEHISVMPVDRRTGDRRQTFCRPMRDAGGRMEVDDTWLLLVVEEGNQRLDDTEFGDRRLGIELRVRRAAVR